MKRCLVADNNVFYLEFFSDVFTSHGYEVITASDGLVALEMARKQTFDIFVLDYVMPKIDGIRLAKYLREIECYKNTPIILITAAALESVALDYNNASIDVFVAKAPFDKMRELFNDILPQIEIIRQSNNKSVIGLENIYPRQIVKELLVTELNYSVIFQSLVEGIVELDEGGSAIFANKSFCEILNKKEHEIIGNKIEDILDFSKNIELKEAFLNLRGSTKSCRETIVCNVGEKSVHFAFYNILGNGNKAYGYFIVLQDITGIKKKVLQITTLFNITQAFLSNLEYRNVLEYVMYELRRLVNATNVTLLFSCEGLFKGEKIVSFDRKFKERERKKIGYWINKIEEWKKSGLINLKHITKLNKIKFENMPILWLPLVFHSTFVGTLIGFKDVNEEFDDEEVKFFEAVGNQLSVYMSNMEFSNNKKHKLSKQQLDVKTQDIIEKNLFLKWCERNKRVVVKEYMEDLSRSLMTMKVCIDVVEQNDIFKKEQLGKLSENLSSSYKKVISIKDDLAILNKTGSEEESDFYVFSMEMLMKRISDDLQDLGISMPENIPPYQMISDFEKFSLYLRLLLRELNKKGACNIKLAFENKDDSLMLCIYFPFNQGFDCLLVDTWQDIDDKLFYIFWELKTIIEFLNTKVTCTLSDENYKISIIFPISHKGVINEKV